MRSLAKRVWRLINPAWFVDVSPSGETWIITDGRSVGQLTPRERAILWRRVSKVAALPDLT
jgi:hypothetical protein